MGKVGDLDRKTVVSVLTQGRERANELKNQLNPIFTSRETCDSLLESILSSYERAIKLLDCMALLGNGEPSQVALSSRMEPPNSIEVSPRSEGSDQNSTDQVHKAVFKKRKTVPRWTEQVRVCTGTGFEGHQFDDGYSWRKYGQKDILGAHHPRAYYRCTHRNTQGCLATKQVQRTDEDPSIFDVLYRGKHSCIQERMKQKRENVVFPKKEEECQRHPQQTTNTTGPGLKVETQEFNTKEDHFPCFSIPSSPLEYENAETKLFSEASNLMGTGCSPPFLSPATSESYFSLSHCPVNDFGIGLSLPSSESDFSEIISNPTPATNIQFADLDFSLEEVNFDSRFLDALDYF